MSLKVIELNDAALKVGDETGILLQSPGFALNQDKRLVVGEVAEQQARLHPTHSYNKYWHELSLDPISHGDGIRHYADIAYAHLLHLTEQAQLDDEVLFVVPGNFTRQQLAILLGLAKQCPFKTIGVVDSALIAAASSFAQRSLVYAELQLHQVVLSRVSYSKDKLAIESVIQVPGVGSQNIMDSLMQLATNAFIEQCRFNPQHNAESEQQLYNALPHWWSQHENSESSLVLELNAGGTVHTAKMPRENLLSSLNGHYQKIMQQIMALDSGGELDVLLGDSLASLPGLTAMLRKSRTVQIVESAAISNFCLKNRGLIQSSETGIRLISTMQINNPDASATGSSGSFDKSIDKSSNEIPTHILYLNQAYPLHALAITNGASLNGHAPEHVINLALTDLPADLGQIMVAGDGVFFNSGTQAILLNQRKVSGKKQLALGDKIQFAANTETLTLIKVN